MFACYGRGPPICNLAYRRLGVKICAKHRVHGWHQRKRKVNSHERDGCVQDPISQVKVLLIEHIYQVQDWKLHDHLCAEVTNFSG